MGKKKIIVDRADLDIISTLDNLGSKSSAQEISRMLNIPDRTVRYRLNKLKKMGLIQPSSPLIWDRKLGLGEHIVLVQEIDSKKTYLDEFIQTIPYFYWINATYGKFTGLLFNAIYSPISQENNEKIMRLLKVKEIISAFFLFDIINYAVTHPDLSYFDPNVGWVWDWDIWFKRIKEETEKDEKNIRKRKGLEEDTSITEFDFKDIILLRELKQKGDISLKRLGGKLALSERQVRRRIKRLEKEKVIKGYISAFTPESYYINNLTYFFFELNEPHDWILNFFYDIPYQLDIFMESNLKYCVAFRASSKDIKGFTKGIELLKPHFASSFLQLVPYTISDRHHLFEAYNKDNKTWETPIEDYINRIKFR